jgi:hypothetical protein
MVTATAVNSAGESDKIAANEGLGPILMQTICESDQGDSEETEVEVDGEVKSDIGGIKVALRKYGLPQGPQSAPFDPTKNWTLGPAAWDYKYSSTKKFWPI